MRYAALFLAYIVSASCAFAYVPNLVTQETLHDITTVYDPELSQAFIGQLNDQPHTYEISAEEPFSLFVQLRIPDIDSSKNNVSGIIIKEQKRGRVEEVTRFLAKDAAWSVKDDSLSGDTYREGASFERSLDAGVYRIEVSTPDNIEKYILMIGTREEMTIGYFELISRLMDMKKFAEKSRFFIIESPYVYWPLVVLVSLTSLAWFVRNRMKVARE